MVTVIGDGLHKLQLPFSFIFDKSFFIFYICNFLNVRMCCFSLTFMTVSKESLGFGLFVRQKKPLFFQPIITDNFAFLDFRLSLLVNCKQSVKVHSSTFCIECADAVFVKSTEET